MAPAAGIQLKVSPDGGGSWADIEEALGWPVVNGGAYNGADPFDQAERIAGYLEDDSSSADETNVSETDDAGQIVGIATAPNDPYYPTRTFSSRYDDMYWFKTLRADDAWDLATGTGVTVAVVDTGLDMSHVDIASNVWTNAGEIAGNGIDDDSNGFVDDVHGWDFVNGDNDATDDHGHGTHVAGIIGASANNLEGIAGIAPESKILPVKVMDDSGTGSWDNIISGIRYAADMGARVINLSLGATFGVALDIIQSIDPDYYDAVIQPIRDALIYAENHRAIVVAAAGNSSVDVNRVVPAAFDEAISVGATTPLKRGPIFQTTGRIWTCPLPVGTFFP